MIGLQVPQRFILLEMEFAAARNIQHHHGIFGDLALFYSLDERCGGASIYDIKGHDFKCLEYGKIYYKEDEKHTQKLKYTPDQDMGGKE